MEQEINQDIVNLLEERNYINEYQGMGDEIVKFFSRDFFEQYLLVPTHVDFEAPIGQGVFYGAFKPTTDLALNSDYFSSHFGLDSEIKINHKSQTLNNISKGFFDQNDNEGSLVFVPKKYVSKEHVVFDLYHKLD